MLKLRERWGISATERERMPVWERDLLLAQIQAESEHRVLEADAERLGMSVAELRAIRGE